MCLPNRETRYEAPRQADLGHGPDPLCNHRTGAFHAAACLGKAADALCRTAGETHRHIRSGASRHALGALGSEGSAGGSGGQGVTQRGLEPGIEGLCEPRAILGCHHPWRGGAILDIGQEARPKAPVDRAKALDRAQVESLGHRDDKGLGIRLHMIKACEHEVHAAIAPAQKCGRLDPAQLCEIGEWRAGDRVAVLLQGRSDPARGPVPAEIAGPVDHGGPGTAQERGKVERLQCGRAMPGLGVHRQRPAHRVAHHRHDDRGACDACHLGKPVFPAVVRS